MAVKTANTRGAALERAIRLRTLGAGPKPYAAAALLFIAVAIWLIAIPLLRDNAFGQPVGWARAPRWGLLASGGGGLLLLAVIVAIAAFVVAIATNRTGIAALAIGVVIVIERVTVTLITDVPIYTWTYKHIGVVDYIMRNHSFAPRQLDVYSQWPSFFAVMSWFSTITGLEPVVAAHWFPALAEAMTSLMVGALALSLGSSIRVALIAAMLAATLNWTGQDYYSPQATGLIMAIPIVALLLSSKKMPVAGYISVPMFAALVPTHQLTPVWVCLLAIGLALFRRIRPLWLPATYLVILAIFILPRRDSLGQYGGLFSGFNPIQNSATVGGGQGSNLRLLTMLVERALAISVWLLAAICFIVMWRRVGAPWAIGIVAFSSMLLLFGQSYGGEGIIRVFLYSIVGCAVLLAIVAARAFDPHQPKRRILAITTVMVLFAAAGMQGFYGPWFYAIIARTQWDQSRQLLASNGGDPLIGQVAPLAGWPERPSADYVRLALQDPWYDSLSLDELRDSLLRKDLVTPQDVAELERRAPHDGRTLYVVLPRQTSAYGDYMGWFEPSVVPSLIERLSESPGWTKVINDENTVVFAYATSGE